jgi:hypothetical protein
VTLRDLPRALRALAHETVVTDDRASPCGQGGEPTAQPGTGSSRAAVPLPCHSQRSLPVPSGQPRTTPRRLGPASFPIFAGDDSAPIWLWEQGVVEDLHRPSELPAHVHSHESHYILGFPVTARKNLMTLSRTEPGKRLRRTPNMASSTKTAIPVDNRKLNRPDQLSRAILAPA